MVESGYIPWEPGGSGDPRQGFGSWPAQRQPPLPVQHYQLDRDDVRDLMVKNDLIWLEQEMQHCTAASVSGLEALFEDERLTRAGYDEGNLLKGVLWCRAEEELPTRSTAVCSHRSPYPRVRQLVAPPFRADDFYPRLIKGLKRYHGERTETMARATALHRFGKVSKLFDIRLGPPLGLPAIDRAGNQQVPHDMQIYTWVVEFKSLLDDLARRAAERRPEGTLFNKVAGAVGFDDRFGRIPTDQYVIPALYASGRAPTTYPPYAPQANSVVEQPQHIRTVVRHEVAQSVALVGDQPSCSAYRVTPTPLLEDRPILFVNGILTPLAEIVAAAKRLAMATGRPVIYIDNVTAGFGGDLQESRGVRQGAVTLDVVLLIRLFNDRKLAIDTVLAHSQGTIFVNQALRAVPKRSHLNVVMLGNALSGRPVPGPRYVLVNHQGDYVTGPFGVSDGIEVITIPFRGFLHRLSDYFRFLRISNSLF